MRIGGFLKGLATGTVFNLSSMVPAIFTSVVESLTLVPSTRKSASRALGRFSHSQLVLGGSVGRAGG